MGVEGGLLVGWEGAGGMGSVARGWVKDADQRLRRREVTMQATGGEEGCYIYLLLYSTK